MDSKSSDSADGNLKTCPYCLALIPKTAIKCSHCRETVQKKKFNDIKDNLSTATLNEFLKTLLRETIEFIKSFDFW